MMKFHPDVLAAHAQFGGDLESMQKCFDWYDLQSEELHQKDRLETEAGWRAKINHVKAENRRLTLECDGRARKQHLLLSALRSIADNTCCEGCQEAARVAREALEGVAPT